MAGKIEAMDLAVMLEWIRQNGGANIETLHGRLGAKLGLSVEGMRGLIEKGKKYGVIDEASGIIDFTKDFSSFFDKGKGRAVEILKQVTKGEIGAGEVSRLAGQYNPVETGKEIVLAERRGAGVRVGSEAATSTARRAGGPYRPIAEGQQIIRKEGGAFAKTIRGVTAAAEGSKGWKALLGTAGRVALPLLLAFTVYDMTVGRGRKEAEGDVQGAFGLQDSLGLASALTEERAKGQTIKNLVGVQAQAGQSEEDFGRLAVGAQDVIGRAGVQTLGAMAKVEGVDAALLAKVIGL